MWPGWTNVPTKGRMWGIDRVFVPPCKNDAHRLMVEANDYQPFSVLHLTKLQVTVPLEAGIAPHVNARFVRD